MELYNTLTKKKERFKPINKSSVSLYTCGLTVYSQPHIGNWVAYIYWDVLQRALTAAGYTVHRVQNITDVGHLTSDEDAGEDKMLKGALREGMTAWKVAEKYINIADNEAYKLLKLIRPEHMPRATDYIAQQVTFVEELTKRGFTYEIPDGIYFDTSKLSNYGELAQLDIEGLQFGARVADTGKKNPTDFAVWKFSNTKEKRDMEWESPGASGKMGFPGWHLECSVMARELLGDQIDIHTGGIDHIPVHHTNEIAQTEAVTGRQFARYWVHANHIKVNGTKMSKSLGNIYTLQDIIDKGYDIEAFKLLVLSKHYRTEGNFTWEILDASQNRLDHWKMIADLTWQEDVALTPLKSIDTVKDSLLKAMADDLNTPVFISIVDEVMSDIEQFHFSASFIRDIADTINALLGIDILAGKSDISEQQTALLVQRQQARDRQNWDESDRIRDELKQTGIMVRDTDRGQVWSRS